MKSFSVLPLSYLLFLNVTRSLTRLFAWDQLPITGRQSRRMNEEVIVNFDSYLYSFFKIYLYRSLYCVYSLGATCLITGLLLPMEEMKRLLVNSSDIYFSNLFLTHLPMRFFAWDQRLITDRQSRRMNEEVVL